ncbi:hypothetical protein Tco_0166486, partial [Tanacetum coccineum]
CLSEYIRQLFSNEMMSDIDVFDVDEMMSHVDVFSPGVLDFVTAEGNGTLVVTIQRGVIIFKAIIRQLRPHPKDLGSASRHSYVFNLC